MRTFDSPGDKVAGQLSHTAERAFNGIDYLISIFSLKPDLLELEIEQKCDASRWKGEFSSKYVEEITMKTGSVKRFPVFVRMLQTALEGRSDTVSIDVLTYNDLEELRRQKGSSPTAATRLDRSNKLVPNNKRYLILTHASEFDRVHYPLPLAFEEVPDPDRLRRVICELRAEIESYKKNNNPESDETIAIVESPVAMQSRTVQFGKRGRLQGTSDQIGRDQSKLDREVKLIRKERDMLKSRLQAIQVELEQERCVHRRELRKQIKETEKSERELNSCRLELKQEKTFSRELQRRIDAQTRQDRLHTRKSSGIPPLRKAKTTTPRSVASSQRSTRSTGMIKSRDASSEQSKGYRSDGSGRSETRSATSTRSRFDPTAYVKKRNEKLQEIEKRKKTAPFRGGPSRRRPSTESKRSKATIDQRSSSNRSAARSGHSSRRSTPESTRSITATSSRKNSIKCGVAKGPTSRSIDSSPAASERSCSPSRALQAIKKKLNRFIDASNEGYESENDGRFEDVDGSHTKEDTDVDDVDQRLAALREFLRAAKDSMQGL